MRRRREVTVPALVLAAPLALLAAGCGGGRASAPAPAPGTGGGASGPAAASGASGAGAASRPPDAAPSRADEPMGVKLTDVTRASGVDFKHTSGAFGARYLPETMGAGLAFLDADGDGKMDLFLANGRPWPGHEGKGPLPTSRLYRNRGDGTFEDVSKASGLDLTIYAMGATAGDVDGDGDTDLYVTALGQDRLFRNDGKGHFTDVTADAGMVEDDFGSSATFTDLDRDGDLDLVVGNYVVWTQAGDIHCSLDGTTKSYCTPESYKGVSPRLWKNDGTGRFTDATEASGLFRPGSKTLGVVAVDLDQDGLDDIVLANDTQPNALFHNKGDGTFEEVGMAAGIAFDENGIARGAMGIDAADYDGSGRPSLIIGNFSNQMLSLYHNEGRLLFVDAAAPSGIGRASLLTLAFGCVFLDADRDGLVDILIANGHVDDSVERVQTQVKHAQPPHLFHNLGAGRFREVTAEMGAEFASPRVARGVAYADWDQDGDLDVAFTVNDGKAILYRNDGGNARSWIAIRTQGTKSNRDGLGAVVKVTQGGRTQSWAVRAASGYLSQSEPGASFGLGAAERVDVEIAWPSGTTDRHPAVVARKLYRAVEGGALEPL